MSGIRSLLSRAIGALGGPQAATMVLVAGILVGGMGGALIAAAHPGGAPEANTVAIYPCPNQGPAILTVAAGQQLLVTGRLADNSWVRIHLPTPGRTEGWVEAGPLTVNGSLDTLPVAGCSAEAAAPSPAIVPVESLTAIMNATPSPAPTPTPSPSPTPSPTPNVGPALTALAASTRTISYDPGSFCTKAVKSVTISVTAADSAGVASVTLFWREPGASTYAQSPMTQSTGSAASGTWKVTLNTAANGINQAGTLSYYIVATDAQGATSRTPSGTAVKTISVVVCVNSGPSITQASASSTLYWDPLGAATATTCQPTATNVTAVVSDPNGVASVTLFFRRPGSSTWSPKAMDNQTIPGKWYANLDTLGDNITIPTPPTGGLSWYIKAVDGANAASQTKASTITVRRCDSPAAIGVKMVQQYPIVSGSINLQWNGSINDPDGLSSATLTFTMTNNAYPTRTVSGTVTAQISGSVVSFTSAAINARPFIGSDTVTWTITTYDQYGGTTTYSTSSQVGVG